MAHRLSAIINCNKINVMDQGKIVESGTYQELMKNEGVFAEK
jgi:ABC-type multidrug transport system fused ATPase/permease subunit